MNLHESIRNIMTRDVVCVQVGDKPSKARKSMAQGGFHHLPVCNGDVLVGVLSMADFAPLGLEKWVPDADTVDAWLDANNQIDQIMSYEPVVVHPEQTVREAANLLANGQYHALPVVDESNCLLGIFTTTDLVRWVAHGA